MSRLTYSPWGAVQSCKQLAEGITQVETASHGGFYLSPERWAKVQAAMPGFVPWGGNGAGWLEEDQDWAVAALVFPEVFPARSVYYAVLAARSCGSEYFAPVRSFLVGEGGKAAYAIYDAHNATEAQARG